MVIEYSFNGMKENVWYLLGRNGWSSYNCIRVYFIIYKRYIRYIRCFQQASELYRCRALATVYELKDEWVKKEELIEKSRASKKSRREE